MTGGRGGGGEGGDSLADGWGIGGGSVVGRGSGVPVAWRGLVIPSRASHRYDRGGHRSRGKWGAPTLIAVGKNNPCYQWPTACTEVISGNCLGLCCSVLYKVVQHLMSQSVLEAS